MRSTRRATARNSIGLAFLLLSVCFQLGCQFVLPRSIPAVQTGASRFHFVENEPFASICPLINRKNEIVGALVRESSYQEAVRVMARANSSPEQPSNAAAVASRAVTMVDGSGVSLLIDGQLIRLDQQELAGGPWIYYFNEDGTFKRVLVEQTRLDEFKFAVDQQNPLEFVKKWCNDQPGEPLKNRIATNH